MTWIQWYAVFYSALVLISLGMNLEGGGRKLSISFASASLVSPIILHALGVI